MQDYKIALENDHRFCNKKNILQQNGVPAHYFLIVRSFLDLVFQDWIGYRGNCAKGATQISGPCSMQLRIIRCTEEKNLLSSTGKYWINKTNHNRKKWTLIVSADIALKRQNCGKTLYLSHKRKRTTIWAQNNLKLITFFKYSNECIFSVDDEIFFRHSDNLCFS